MTGAPDPVVEAAAVAAADRVDPSGKLRGDVLAALHSTDRTADRYSEIVDIAALVVAVATFVWTVVQARRTKAEPPPKPEVVARRIRVEFPLADNISPQQRDLIVDVVVERILAEER
ncbi:hypothetical protein [Actinokineospora globicatena]|uniref:Uncharacterized protein n=1 Tax=Actinokineospora globicatena TaxID=103729 RepID=A0A9W6V7Y8_9PSEU|nr:hypothetical protein [Actinokineospora globicatena]GLW90424.1 hypothetical protein Aglo03_12400 [Actinokineospora globicatena]